MRKTGFLNIIIAIVIAVVAVGGAYVFIQSKQEKDIGKNTGLSQELLNIPLVKEYISDASGAIDKGLLPFQSDSYQLELRLVTMPGEWDKYKSSYFVNGSPAPQNWNDGTRMTLSNYSADKNYAIQFPTNEHGGANLWDLKGQLVYQLCSHCGIVSSYWMDDNKFVLFNIISAGQSEDGKYHKAIQLYDLVNKTISVSQSAGIADYESLRLDSFNKPAETASAAPAVKPVQPAFEGTTTVKIALTGSYDEIKSGDKFGCEDVIVMVPRQIPKTPQVLNAAFRELFAAPSSVSYNGHDLYNVIYAMGKYSKNPLQFDRAIIDSGVAKIYFRAIEGTFGATGGTCDDPRVRPVIEATAKQFPTVKSVEIYLNNKLFDWTNFGSQR